MAKAYNLASISAAVVWLMCGAAVAQPDAPDGSFTLVRDIPPAVAVARANVRPLKYQAVRVNWDALTRTLAQAPLEDTPAAANPVVVSLPMPEGWFARFRVVESPIMEPGLAAAFPDIKTYLGQGIDDPAASVRFDRTMHGFHAQILSPAGRVFIDPFSFDDTSHVTSYHAKDAAPRGGWACHTVDEGGDVAAPGSYSPRAVVVRKTFRLAVAGTGEYTAFHGGTVAGGQAAIVTAINRVSGIYEIDLAARLVLVANNQNLVFTNAATDPYSNSGGSGDLTANHNTCNSVIGSANYDIGHLFCTGNGGVASISSVCSTANKGRGLSGLPQPINDPFSVDYVAHEMGHQFAGRHCFNNCGGGPGDSQSIAYEPGSGATIMAYAGICGNNDLQPNSDAMFHSGSLETMKAFISAASCPVSVTTGNNTPTVSAGPDRTVPRSTPLWFEAVGSDVDGDTLTYSWEERDTGAAVNLPLTDNGSSPIQRTWLPSLNPARTVPRRQNLLNNTTAVGEILPTTGRLLRYRVVARDNAAGNGGFGTDDVVYTVSAAAGPFVVTSPNTNVSWQGVQTVTWNVANTNAAPVSCANVQILLSTDGGNTFPTVLAAGTPNDGSETVTLPGIATNQARIAVKAVDNIFFDISNVNFTVNNAVTIVGTGVVVMNDSAGGNGNGVLEPGETGVTLLVELTNSGGINGTGVSAVLSSLTPTAQVVSGASAYPNLPAGAVGSNATPFVIDIDAAHVCGDPINLRLDVATAQGPSVVNFALATGTPAPPVTAATVAYSGAVIPIPDNDATGVNAAVVVSGLPAVIRDVNLRFNGTTCSTAANAPTVGLSHGNMGDIVVTLTAPNGASCVVIDRPGIPGSTNGNSGNNLCNSIFDDEAVLAFEAASASAQPFTGSWRPLGSLAALNGGPANGTWTVNVKDLRAGDAGTLRFFSLVVSSQPRPTCANRPCDSDFNCDGNADQDDVACIINVVAGNPGCECLNPDFNNDGNVDQDDVAALINTIAAGPCP